MPAARFWLLVTGPCKPAAPSPSPRGGFTGQLRALLAQRKPTKRKGEVRRGMGQRPCRGIQHVPVPLLPPPARPGEGVWGDGMRSARHWRSGPSALCFHRGQDGKVLTGAWGGRWLQPPLQTGHKPGASGQVWPGPWERGRGSRRLLCSATCPAAWPRPGDSGYQASQSLCPPSPAFQPH